MLPISARGVATDTNRIAYVSGCRAWNVSDDGFDIGSMKQLKIDSCWSWGNGAGWNFMVLGLIQALAINYEFFTKNIRNKVFSRIPDNMRKAIGRIITYLFFGSSLVFFFSPDLQSALRFFSGLFVSVSMPSFSGFGLVFYPALLISLVLLLSEFIEEDYYAISRSIGKIWNSSFLLRFCIYYIMIMCVLALIGSRLTFVYQAF